MRTWVNQSVPGPDTEGYVVREVAQWGSQLARVTNDKRECGRLLGDAPQRPLFQGP